ncbi:TerB family tellurite resistance protein [Thetidibacter halocola]|uniref:TerB family tellurite resistance protein n=1 Tax=Thetidibacter halocola TaxID=2827239 RepID=A0A8J8B6E9_9RHOB|nr:TerB family tellurite resistance protein [Thetidibacter halocola]MBS0123227.1 TerB family tellurite resistance protein [Thetidibacter halocola]
MFERLKRFFTHPAPPQRPLPEPDARHALGTLLVRVALADGAYLFEEVEQIDRILARAYRLKPLEAAKMRAECERLALHIDDDTEMARRIREAVDYDHRLEKVRALWAVVMADGVSDEKEEALVALVEDTLGVARPDSEAARAAASIP